jgi:hypothetical protein
VNALARVVPIGKLRAPGRVSRTMPTSSACGSSALTPAVEQRVDVVLDEGQRDHRVEELRLLGGLTVDRDVRVVQSDSARRAAASRARTGRTTSRRTARRC